MSALSDSERERLATLLVDQATQALVEEDQRELEGLLARQDELDVEGFDRAAAAIALALARGPHEPLPAELRRALEQDARRFVGGLGDALDADAGDVDAGESGTELGDGAGAPLAPVRAGPGTWLGWGLAAAAAVVAVGALLVGRNERGRLDGEVARLERELEEADRRLADLRERQQLVEAEAARRLAEADARAAAGEDAAAEARAVAAELQVALTVRDGRVAALEGERALLEDREAELLLRVDELESLTFEPSPAEALAALLAAAPEDLVEIPWSATEDELVAGVEIAGRIVWSGSRQEGYMVLDGLPANDPGLRQYQLWIFDQVRPEATPVDGGVFDIAAGAPVVVPIDPKLVVREPYLFAVTAERPGGVVVSSREDLLLVAGA